MAHLAFVEGAAMLVASTQHLHVERAFEAAVKSDGRGQSYSRVFCREREKSYSSIVLNFVRYTNDFLRRPSSAFLILIQKFDSNS